MKFNQILKDINREKVVNPSDLLPFLCLESRSERCRISTKLAKAYVDVKDFRKAKECIQRAWILSEFSVDLLPLYLRIHASLHDIRSIQEAYKRVGMEKASQQKILESINYFQLSMNAYAAYQNADHYDYDFDILERIEELAEPHRFEPKFHSGPLERRKVRLAYLVHGTTQKNSVVIKICELFARFHDKSRFEVAFFVPEGEFAIFHSLQGKDNVKALKNHDCKVSTPKSDNGEERLFETALQIYNYQPDILLTTALLAEFTHYFIASLLPAPVTIGFIMGPPPQFASFKLDRGITFTKHPLIDSPCNCSLVGLNVELPDSNLITFMEKQEFNLPEDSIILMSGGRYTKFQSVDFWNAIFDIMRLFPTAYYLTMGIDKPLPFFEGVSPDLKKRIRFLGWQDDYLKVIGMADILIDTYPSGGGVVLLEAMALGMPVVTFRNNYMQIFSQTDWSPGEEFIDIPDLIIERDNFEQFRSLLSKLINDTEFRLKMAKLCKEKIHLSHGDPEKMVRECESIYTRTLEEKMQKNISCFFDKGQTPIINEIENLNKLSLHVISILRKLKYKFRERIARIYKIILS